MSGTTIGPVDIEFALKNLNFQAEAEKMKQGIRGITTTAQQEAQKTNDVFRQMVAGIGVYFSATFVKQFAMEIVNVRGEFQQLNIAFETMLGSKEKADKLMQEAVAFSQKTPFTLTDVATNIKQLMAMGIASEKVMGTMKALGDVAAGVSVPISRVAINYGQVAVLGTLQQREIRDFAMAGIPLVDELAKNLGKSKEEIQGMVSAGQIGFPEVEKAFQTMSGVGGKFYNLMEKQNASVTGQISNLTDKWQVMLNSIGEANEGMIYGSISGLSSLITNYEAVLDILKVMVVTYGIYKTASIAVAVADGYAAAAKTANAASTYMLIGRTTQLTFAQYASAQAQGVLNAVMAINPYVLAATAIAALVTAMVVFSDTTDEASKAQDEINKTVNTQKANVETLVSTIKNENAANADRAKALKELNDILPDQIGFLDAQALSTEKGKKAIDDYIESIRKRAEMEQLTAALKKNLDEQDRIGSGKLTFWESLKQLNSSATTNPEELKRRNEVYLSSVISGLKDEEDAIKAKMAALMASKKEEKSANEEKIRTIELINQEIDDAKKAQLGATNRKDYNAAQVTIDRLEAEKIAITGVKEKSKELKGEYDKLEEKIKKASDAVVNATEKERPALQEKLNALVKQKIAWEELIKAQRGETTGMKPLSVNGQISGESAIVKQLQPMKQLTEEQKKQLEAKGKQASLDAVASENYEKNISYIQGSVDLLDQMTAQYAEQLGLSKEQAKALENGMNMMKGIAQIASGNIVGGAISIISGMASFIIQAPEKLSVHFEQVNAQISKLISSLDIATESLSSLGQDSSLTSIKIVKAELLTLADEAATLNTELAKSSSGPRRNISGGVAGLGLDMVKQAADLNLEIEKLANRLLQGDISDEQRKAIEAVLDSYNSLLSQIDSTIQDITGTTVSDLSRGLADAFLAGEDAAAAWGEKVDDIIKNIITRQLTAQLLTKPINEAVNTLVNDSGNGLTTDEALKFKKTMDDLYASSAPMFEATQRALQAAGFNFDASTSTGSTSGVMGSVKGATEETMGAMVGQLMAVRVDIKSILVNMAAGQDDVAKNLGYLKQISENTSHNVKLIKIEEGISEMNKTLKDRL
jgi:tape measure domain-containing protein